MYGDLWSELDGKLKELDHSIGELRRSGTAYAEAQKAYKIKLREWCLRLKSQGMAIGLIDKTCYGIPEVAELRFRRDVADTIYHANMDAINALKLEIRIIDAQIAREYGRPQAGY